MSLRKALSFAALCAVAVIVCGFDAEGKAGVKRAGFGRTADGRDVDIYTLTNRRGAEARVITYGGAIVSLKVADRRGPPAHVLLGFGCNPGLTAQTFLNLR